MLKIHQLFVRTFIIIFLSILVLISITTYFWSKAIYIEQIEKNLFQNIDSLSVSLNNISQIESVIKKLKEKISLRITVIDKNGLVIAESDKDKSTMDNHLNRYEISHAKHEGFGKSIRYSRTLKKDLIYVAKKVKINNQYYYIRMADYLDNITNNFMSFSFQIIPIFALFLILAFIGTFFIAKRIQNETANILTFLTKITKKEEVSYLRSSYTVEFDKIARLLKKVAIRLSKKDKQKLKQTAKLKLSNRQKDDIISAISHEFKNPIAIISGYSQTILDDKDLPEVMKEKFLQKIQSNSLKMSHIIDRLRLALKLDENKEEAIFQQLSVKKILQDVISDLKVTYKDAHIILEGDDSIKAIDETLFSIAMSNLIENSLKYSEQKVIISLNKDSLSVIDEGIGISTENIEKLTKKFYRVSNNGWNNSLGLGLNIVHNILNLHKFNLKIDSELGVGSKFTIYY